MSHLLCESFAIAYHNTYKYKNSKFKGVKFIGDLLGPHFVNLIAINTLARETLVAKAGDQLSEFFGIQGKIFPLVFAEWYNNKDNLWNSHVGFYDELRSRGFDENFKHPDKYRFFKDGKLVYDAIAQYVNQVIDAFYKNDNDIKSDHYLDLFFKEVHDEDRGDVKGFPAKPESKTQLANILTKLIWQLSGYHSATNFT